MGAIFKGPPKSKDPPPLPPVPAPPPAPSDPAVQKAKTQSKQLAALAAGSTILTSPGGLTTPASTTKKTLLGV